MLKSAKTPRQSWPNGRSPIDEDSGNTRRGLRRSKRPVLSPIVSRTAHSLSIHPLSKARSKSGKKRHFTLASYRHAPPGPEQLLCSIVKQHTHKIPHTRVDQLQISEYRSL